ncbi:MAG: biotin/lipoyl-binding carrier protein [Reyranellaceae bacterium]
MSDIKVEVTGSVWKVERVTGDSVAAGDVLMIIESMKMEIPVLVEEPGTVLEIRVRAGDSVNEGDVVAVLG